MKNGKELSVWSWPYKNSYYIFHPIKWIKTLFKNIRNAHHRVLYGYCIDDWRNFDNWFLCIASKMLNDMAQFGVAYPGSDPFDTPEKWRTWLCKMADQLNDYKYDYDILNKKENEYYAEYERISKKRKIDFALHDDNLTKEESEIRKKYFDRQIQIQEKGRLLFINTMDELIEYWDDLWD